MSVTFVKFEGNDDQHGFYLVAEQITIVQPDLDNPETHCQIFLGSGETRGAVVPMSAAKAVEHIERASLEARHWELQRDMKIYQALERQRFEERKRQKSLQEAMLKFRPPAEPEVDLRTIADNPVQEQSPRDREVQESMQKIRQGPNKDQEQPLPEALTTFPTHPA